MDIDQYRGTGGGAVPAYAPRMDRAAPAPEHLNRPAGTCKKGKEYLYDISCRY